MPAICAFVDAGPDADPISPFALRALNNRCIGHVACQANDDWPGSPQPGARQLAAVYDGSSTENPPNCLRPQ